MAAGTYSAASYRILGTAATPHNLLTIENTDAVVQVRIRDITVQLDATAVLVSVMPLVKVSRATAVPTGGTALTKGEFNTGASSDAQIIVRCATSADGAAATAITSTAGATLWQEYQMRMHTVVGQVLSPPSRMPAILTKDLVLLQNQALLVQVVASAGGSNPATNHWSVCITWDET
jgi:hypothetical protein